MVLLLIFLAFLATSVREATTDFEAPCVCSSSRYSSPPIRTGPGRRHPILGNLWGGLCIPFEGDRTSTWLHVNFNGRVGSTSFDCPRIISREEWGARSPSSITNLTAAARYAFIHHGESRTCSGQSSCSAIVRSYQNYHMDTNGWTDIGFNFLIGEDGNVYEGRGWDREPAYTRGYDSDSLGFCMIGNFTTHVPNSAALNTLKDLIACGVNMGKIRCSYILRGHRDMGNTDCPWTALYNLIRTWPHY
ncbi:peptidoglycan-recognition protein SC2-like isoform X2 [Haliotis rufescens]|uniref:peptidoglycan-recognition protein SC2-like isoform X2 n=1 Tax=Haliotis rufescens TaxID=6454 RepID=UPI00201F8D31|nr:peptidoglycan-recognition protein SC2-like isoform X2 [Haliotis rufescens]